MFILAVQINPTIGDIDGNCLKILSGLKRAREKGGDVVLFPELALCGYFPEDLLLDRSMIDACAKKLEIIAPETRGLFAVVGLPRFNESGREKPLFNSAAVFADGILLGFKNKKILPTYDVFDERRYFEPGKDALIWEYKGKRIGITICEDVWQHTKSVKETSYYSDPILELKQQRPNIVLNLSASPFCFGKRGLRNAVFQGAAKTLKCPVVCCNQVGANDQLIFDGHSLAIDSSGALIAMAKGFEEDILIVDIKKRQAPSFFVESSPIQEVHDGLVLGVRDYFHKQGFTKAVIGLSGGIDSAVTACIAVEALGKENVCSFTLPSRFSSESSLQDAHTVAKNLGISIQEISIDATFQHYLDLLEPIFKKKTFDITEENLQARIRTMILMAFSNKEGPIMLYPGDKSEMAMGYTTLYGDLAGGLGVLLDVTKTRVYQLGRVINQKKLLIPDSIFTKAPTPELKEGQKTSDSLPLYEILDPIIEDYIEEGLGLEEISKKRGQTLEYVKKIVHQIHLAEYKRRQAPIGLRITQKAFAKGRYVPIVQKWR